MPQPSEPIIGYCGFELFEECYGYSEDACYIAGTQASAREFMEYAAFGQPYRIEPVTLSRIMADFGCSLGEFAMEKNAFQRFRDAAHRADVHYDFEPIDDCSPECLLVNVHGVKRLDD